MFFTALIYVRPAQKQDTSKIISIFNSAKQFLRQQGINQWQNHYPNLQSLKRDIANRTGYVLIYEQQIAGTASLIPGPDKSYLHIQDGEWVNGPKAPYITIHRVAISNQFRGKNLSQILMSNLISLSIAKGFRDVRIDTHPNNKGMRHVIISNGFTKRGLIHTLEGEKQINSMRYAYQLIIRGEHK